MSIYFNGGSTAQQSIIIQAQALAATLTNNAIAQATTSPDFVIWFGTSTIATVVQNFTNILSTINTENFLYDFTALTNYQVTNGLYLGYSANSSSAQIILNPSATLFMQLSIASAISKAAFSIIQLCGATTTSIDLAITADKVGAMFLAEFSPDQTINSPANYRYFAEALTHSNFPIGAITLFAGDLSKSTNLAQLITSGWLLCDGNSYSRYIYPDLYDVIGMQNGGDGSNLNVPDLRSRFLRGVAESAINIDPDANARIAAAPGGATGDKIGSLQKTATAIPVNPWILDNAGDHTHKVVHLNTDMHLAWSGSTYSMARWNEPADTDNSGAHFHTLSGFDNVTTPINIALYFIIKAEELESPTGITPSGSIIGLAGTVPLPPPQWLKCNGAAFGNSLYPNLANACFYNFGGDGTTVFNVPDLRGYFLRATSHNTQRDPNASTRYELNTGGNTGDNIGSAQLCATVTPTALVPALAGAHYHNIALVPQYDHHAAWGASGPAAFNCMVWTDAQTSSSVAGNHTHTVMGGDKETRPENIYAGFLIANDNIQNSAPPIGTVMSFGGDITDPGVRAQLILDGWFPCDGSSLRISAFQDLYNIIGTIFGTAPLKFFVPDLRGYFVTGAGKIPVGTILSLSSSGISSNPIITTTNGDHNHSMPNIPTETHVIDVVAGVDLAANNSDKSPTSTDGNHTHVISGGDLESRPINVNVDYIIRYT